MRSRLFPFAFSVIGFIVGSFIGVWMAGRVEIIYAPFASGSDDLDSLFLIIMAVGCLIFSLLFSFVGFRIGAKTWGWSSRRNTKLMNTDGVKTDGVIKEDGGTTDGVRKRGQAQLGEQPQREKRGQAQL